LNKTHESLSNSKSSFFHTPLHSKTPLGEFPSEYHHPVWCGKLEWCGYPTVKNFKDIFIRFDATHECDRQTNRRTDTAWRHIPRLCICIAR